MAKYKIERNEKCLCGSGNKYKKCCLNKTDEEIYSEEKGGFNRFLIELEKESHIELCMHPDKSQCSSKIVDAHSLQNNGVLNRLSTDGEVLMYRSERNKKGNIILRIDEIHKNSATTFKGFCNYHDSKLYAPIENKRFNFTEEQIFLYAYRALCLKGYHSIDELSLFREAFKRTPNRLIENDRGFLENIKATELKVQDFESSKSEFDIAILNNKFNILETVLLELDYEILFSCTSSFTPIYDLNGVTLNNVFSKEPERLKYLYITCIPMEGISYVFLSCLKTDLDVLGKYLDQINSESKENQKIIISNIICCYIENLVLSKKLADVVLTNNEINSFERMYFKTLGNCVYVPEVKDLKKNYGFNLFKRINLFR